MLAFFYGTDTYRSQQHLATFFYTKPTVISPEKQKKGDIREDNNNLSESNQAQSIVIATKEFFDTQGLFFDRQEILFKNILTNTDATTQHTIKNIVANHYDPKQHTVVFWEEGEIRKTTVLKKWLIQNAEVQKEFVPLKGKNLEKWLKEEAQRFIPNTTIAPNAIPLLSTISAQNPQEMVQCLHATLLFVGKDGIVDAESLSYFLPQINEDHVFSAIEHAIFGRKKEALELVRKTLTTTDEAFRFFGLLALQIRALVVVTDAYKQNTQPSSENATTLGLHPFILKKVSTAAKTMGITRARSLLILLEKIDRNVKSGKYSMDQAIERLLFLF